ncbi:hypothetical protein V6N13_008930 [Hibiscus sabdariffa]|uniref:NAC domain-containing protein n=1 Tax=Hibiscus sabdariffa TaxID=183260 RepID=A0ABR2NRG0_9ROSI
MSAPQELESLSSKSKEEIFSLFLIPVVVNGEPIPAPCRKLDIYGEDNEPWNIFDKSKRGPFWVFTQLTRMSRSRMERTAGSGFWRAWGNSKVLDEQGQVLGFQKKYTFIGSDQPVDLNNGHWTMTEYSLKNPDLNDQVLCEIKNAYPTTSTPEDPQPRFIPQSSNHRDRDSHDYSAWGSDLSLSLKPSDEETMPNHVHGISDSDTDMRNKDPQFSPNQQDLNQDVTGPNTKTETTAKNVQADRRRF